MAKSKQIIKSGDFRGRAIQYTNADDAQQTVLDVKADSLYQRVESHSVDLVILARELAILRKAMRDDATDAAHDIAIGLVASAENAASAGDESATLRHLKSAGQWALQVSEKVGVSVATAAFKISLGI